MKKLLLPGLIVAMGLGGAYASNKLSSKAVPTFRIEGTQCVQVNQECDENLGELCTYDGPGGGQLYKFKLNETTCSEQLHRSIN
ncbi:hypothetical protein J2810_002572 [Chryseobacterium rhizosphaerae]|uniref:DUF6520 family protein n=1 Tax=Chryseobacterium rhizosphaerae TaxID=395937 RepID=UPI0028562F87|nr:DUF6520 family protein [Chryseobacterium rhizosphaerae]MDR6546513.1 hypothetical protein [Chryseobacterium rhizosphaerae]